MKISKIFLFALVLFAAIPYGVQAQDYTKGWKAVDSLLKKQYYSQAYDKSQKLYDQALKANDSWQSLVGAHYLSMVGAKFKEDNSDSSLARYQRLLPQLSGKEKAVCHMLMAGFYSDYYSNYRWRISQNKATDESDLDYKLWDKARFHAEVEIHLRTAFADKAMLKRVVADSLANFVYLSDNGTDGDLTPTLFDVMVLKTNAIFRNMEYRKLNERNFNDFDDIVSLPNRFAEAMTNGVDSVQGMAEYVLSLNQAREQMHLSIGSGDRIMIKLYRDRIQYMINLVSLSNYAAMRMRALPEVINHFRRGNDASITELYYDLADLKNDAGQKIEAVALIDTAVKLHPESHGAVNCYNLKLRIQRPFISLKVPNAMPSGRNSLAEVKVSNVDTLYFRIIEYVKQDIYEENKWRKKLLSCKVLKDWTLPVVDCHDYKKRALYLAIPEMPQGKYMLLASNNKAFDTVIDLVTIRVEDVALVKSKTNRRAGFLIDRKDGTPIVGLEVSFVAQKNYNSEKRTIATTKTDSHGHFDFSNKMKDVNGYYYKYFVYTYNGFRTEKEFDDYYYEYNDSENRTSLFFDRPVYKPGDTVYFSLFNYSRNRYEGLAVKGRRDMFIVSDINDKSHDTIPFVTDEYGTANGSFAIPVDAMPGQWRVRLEEGRRWFFKVESYKQPKFTVTLSKPAELRAFGKAAHVEGIAASYSAVPINGAKVTYSVTRSEMRPYWRWGWSRWWRFSESQVIVTGELTTDDKGMFNIEFVPMPDSVSDLSRKPAFTYSVSVSVTDINGETHEAATSLSVGYENSYLRIHKNNDSISLSRNSLEGDELDGRVQMTVELLATPSKALLHNDMIKDGSDDVEMPYSRSEFEKLFPSFDYLDSTADYTKWSASKKLFDKKGNVAADKPLTFSLAGQPEGVYKVTAMMVTEQGDTLRSMDYYLHEKYDSKIPVKSDLIVGRLKSSTCYVGDTVHLRIGTRHDDVTYYVLIHKDGVMYRHEMYKVSRGFVELAIPVTDSLLGGFRIEVAAMKENHFEYDTWSIEVPYRHKELDVCFETFRDKLTPGTPERWTLRIKEKLSGKPAKANLMMTMYDAALDKYGSLSWYQNIWTQGYSSSVFSSIFSTNEGRYAYQKALNLKIVPNDYRFRILMLKGGIYSTEYSRLYNQTSRKYNKGAARAASTARGEDGSVGEPEVTTDLEIVEDNVEIENELGFLEEEVYSIVEVGNAESAQRLVVDEPSASEQGTSDEELHVRQNLSTLAFFQPTLRSDDNGTVEISFTAPDLLTKWNIKGLAWTPDLKHGSLYETAITQKRLMVVPNVPRFLRHGDTCIFSIKVSNMDDKEQNIAVTLRMTNAESGQPLPIIVGDTVRNITLKAGTSGEVRFTLAAPRAPIFVANYLVVARGQGCSDGEQAPIPLLPSRQLVTESMAFYINGVGEKHYEMKHLTQLDTTAADFSLSTLGLTVDLTPNPIWMAMQSLPYVQQRKNPSNIYLANAIYTNSLSYAIVKNNPKIEGIFREWEKQGYDVFISELERNSDLKQTVMSETPWLRDATSEEQRHRDVAKFFNKITIEHQLKKDLDRLLDAQRSDGGWSWIDGASYSSLYTTQYILKTFGLLRQQGVDLDSRTRRALNRAMDYVDKETYTYYKKYIKNHGYDVVNLDYLYVRSYYPDNKLSKSQKEAYDFFYNNAKKYNESYRSLFTQSMLSVVFYRHGDKKLAHEMAKRIKEKALYSDEMGMYWRDNVSGWSWSERPIETQAMLIRTMDEVLGDRESVAKMQQWILKQKQTTNWNTDVSTVSAIQALLVGTSTVTSSSPSAPSPIRIEPSNMTLTFGKHQLTTDTTLHQLHISQRLGKGEVTPADGYLTIRKEDDGIAWGAMYWQYFEQVDKIPSSSMGVTLKRTLYRVERDGKLSKIAGTDGLKVGDKVRIRIEISCDRNLEYLELKDPRCAAMEPVSTASGWHWNGGLSYYLSITNAAQTLFIDRLEKGKYVAEYDMYVNNAGTYVSAPTTIQCLYAPEFRALCPAEKLKVNGE